MTPKEQKIQEAWGEVWNELPESQKVGALKYNGWVSHSECRLSYSPEGKALVKKLYGISKKDVWLSCDQFAFRPTSLSGIENNNGWIKIESEDDLPMKGITCHFILKSGVQGVFIDLDDSEYITLKNRATHYKIIEKPKPPIY